jgi:hypothetical protein
MPTLIFIWPHDIMQEVYLKILLNINKVEQADNMAAWQKVMPAIRR